MNGINLLAVIPLRAEGSDRAEIVSQLLFGETYQILESADRWIRIKTDHDHYEGWICFKQNHPISAELMNQLVTFPHDYTRSVSTTIETNDGALFEVPMGSDLRVLKMEKFPFRDEILEQNRTITSTSELIQAYRNVPYLWGGRTFMGIDCSGFSQLYYRFLGIQIPRDASQQIEVGTPVDFENRQPGDLAFFNNPQGKITHVGIVDDQLKMAHASGFVRIDPFTNKGIIHSESQELTHVLHSIKRIK